MQRSRTAGGGESEGRTVRFMGDGDRKAVLGFLREIDERFLPPLSSPKRRGSIEGYLDYMLAEGRGKVLLYEKDGRVEGLFSYRFEGDRLDTMYLCAAGVREPRSGAVALYRMCEAMVDAERDRDILRVWAKTWEGNQDSRRFLEKIGLKLKETVPGDFGGSRTTVTYEGAWQDIVGFFDRRVRREPPLPELKSGIAGGRGEGGNGLM